MRKKKRHPGRGKRLFDRIQQAQSTEEVDSIYASEADQQASQGRRTHFYVRGFSPKKGKVVIVGGYASEEEAERIASNSGMVGFNVIELPTSSLAKATQIIKARKLDKGVNIDDAVEHIRHKGEDIGL